jgi:hypothetical protein
MNLAQRLSLLWRRFSPLEERLGAAAILRRARVGPP